jgi:hypothetical protein
MKIPKFYRVISRNQRPPVELGYEDGPLTNSSLACILFASASLGGGCSAGACQQIVKNMQKNFISKFIF